MPGTFDQWLRERTIPRELIDRFLDASAAGPSQFDPETGYAPRGFVSPGAMDGGTASASYGSCGERRGLNGIGERCRINCYGDSFTECAQVSDGETWQEYLAAHFREPVRNFGVSGHGAYQACLRLQAKEATRAAAENVIFYLWGDDHHRSLMPWRGFFWRSWLLDPANAGLFGLTPWRHLAFDTGAGEFRERPNPCPSPFSLYRLSDEDFVHGQLCGNLMMQLSALAEGIGGVPLAGVRAVAERFAVALDSRDATGMADAARRLIDTLAFASSRWVVDRLLGFCTERRKRLFLLLGSTDAELQRYLRTGRKDPEVVALLEHLESRGVSHLDIRDRHREEYTSSRLTPKGYTDRYYIGHYNPRGNHFFAFAIKDALVAWLDPKPLPYRDRGEP